jgi:hypothetical protein
MSAWARKDSVETLLTNVPPVPALVQYYDEFSDSYIQVTDANTSELWTISFDGRSATLDFGKFDVQIRGVVQSWCAEILASLSPRTAQYYYHGLRRILAGEIRAALTSVPQEIRPFWNKLHAGNLPYESFSALHNLITFCCNFHIASWGPRWLDLVSQLPFPKKDKYASVRVGDVFLSIDEEAAIVGYIDHVGTQIEAEPAALIDEVIVAVAILVCTYQLGFRAKQIALLRLRDIRIWKDGVEERPAVHLTFVMIKQRSNRSFPMVRRVKREWVFEELFRRAKASGLNGEDHVFRMTPAQVSKMLADMTDSLLNGRRTVTELRHTAAQRLVDAGASEEELAAFMGHSDLNTGLIYFRSSVSQGERVNQALGVSAVYQRVAKIAHDRFISAKELTELKGDQQIGGVPHGIPIAGIGGYSSGQPSCPYNPIMSCYGCSKFMPVADSDVHNKVLEDLRGVMKFFYASSRAERGSPAFQLEKTISSVQAVLNELGAKSNELVP